MSGRPHIKITESVESLREILKQQKRIGCISLWKIYQVES